MEKFEIEVIEAVKEDTLYDYIGNNYWHMDRSLLRDIIKELSYAVFRAEHGRINAKDIRKEVVHNLKEIYKEEE